MASCRHQILHLDVSSHAAEVGFDQPGAQQRLAATLPSGRVPSGKAKIRTSRSRCEEDFEASGRSGRETASNSTFPAPLVLPGDELAHDPKCARQSLRSWLRLMQPHSAVSGRRKLYIVPYPTVDSQLLEMRDWAQPAVMNKDLQPPLTVDLLAYLTAFYHGSEVEMLDTMAPRFTRWSGAKPKRDGSGAVGLLCGQQMIRIRTRPSKDASFAGQLNLNDLLDAAIAVLPADAYALIMLVHHDLFEDDQDDFCCGRAYGGSRVCVVSTARYNPLLDEKQEVEREHAWPASHCRDYVRWSCYEQDDLGPPVKKGKKNAGQRAPVRAASPMEAALEAHRGLDPPKTNEALRNLWLGRVCKTASHELGHCFGMDHCTYYACLMQGTASLTEDARQPPYLCPVETAKLNRAPGATSERERDRALLHFCERYPYDRLFSAYTAWLRVRLAEPAGVRAEDVAAGSKEHTGTGSVWLSSY